MNLSNILFNTVANKLNLKTSLLQKERFYVKNLLNQITYHAHSHYFGIFLLLVNI